MAGDLQDQLTQRLTHATLAEVGLGMVAAAGSSIPPPPDPIEPGPISLAFADGALAPEGADVSAADADLVVTGILGMGGMGTVYLAQQRTLGREVAVKLARHGDLEPHLQAALVAEARLVGSLEHPNIIPVHAVGRDHRGLPLLVMKRVEGVAWSELLDDPNHPAWSRDELASEDRLAAHLQILMQVANAVHFANTRGVVHRDVKPGNVMVGPFGEVYLLDWGMALRRGTTPRAGFFGTPAYMAPEMLKGDVDAIDARTDVYLLGATLHEILTGQRRHAATSLLDALTSAQVSAPFPYDAEVPRELAELCNAATHPDPERRPASAAVFRQSIATYLHHRTSIAMTSQAQAKLDALEAMQATTGSLAGIEIMQRLVECRFAFLEALRSWRGNEPARRGLDACLGWMIRRELALENVSAARSFFAELDRPDAALATRIDEVEARVCGARERAAAVSRFAREMDPGVWRGPRVIALAAMLVIAVVVNVVGTAREVMTGIETPITSAILMDVGQVLALFVGVAVVGLKVLTNRYNRRFFAVALVATASALALDSAAWLRGIDTGTANLFDAIMGTAVLTVAAHTLEPKAWTAVAVWAGATLLCVTVPSLTNVATTSATVMTIAIAIWITRASASRSPEAW